MRKWRRESVLDLYNLLFAMLLFVSPWLFARGGGRAAIDLWASSAAIAIISLAAIIAFSNWEEWACAGNLAHGFAVGTGIHPYQRDAF